MRYEDVVKDPLSNIEMIYKNLALKVLKRQDLVLRNILNHKKATDQTDIK